MEQQSLIWGLALMLGYPLLNIGLGEIIIRLRSKNNPLFLSLKNLRFLVFPPLITLLVMLYLLKLNDQNIWVQGTESVLGGAVIITIITLLNAIFMPGQKRQYSWQIDVPNLLFQFARVSVALGIFAYLLAMVWQVDLTELFTALGVGSLVIALALQDTLSNLVSGFLLIFESPFKVGDWVRIKDLEGEVLEINWRAVRIKTRERDVVIIPNGVLGKDTIYNYTLLDPLHADRLTFTFSSDAPPNKVIQVLKSAANDAEEILSTPEPLVRPIDFSDYVAKYEVKYYIEDFNQSEEIQGQFVTNVYYAAKRNHLADPVPVEKHFLMPYKILEKSNNRQDILETLNESPIFNILGHEMLSSLAQQAQINYYGVGEVIIHAGELDQGLCILMVGQVMLSAPGGDQKFHTITYLERNDIFGEMALLRDEPSLVSVKVLQDVTLLMLDGETIFSAAQQNSAFSLAMNQFIEERKNAVQRAVVSNTLAIDSL
ncbi:mechanosensitive ion channel [Spirulina sp. CS-785/01]|uniref:mechanosensitive ion channel domain-containing protein n=1 Tax=Spirulina sp. CS-785/01 TaxID=3021716 RepID=UPI002330666E|nr:mechanosensitive ion channel domain-containing protein [Spirulina sp. CS-785/01]MDB9312240.1 mechanosensitive ion channel [Spirulina sp. CS-785/01]